MRRSFLALPVVLVAAAGVALVVTTRDGAPPFRFARPSTTAHVVVETTAGPDGDVPVLHTTMIGVADLSAGSAALRVESVGGGSVLSLVATKDTAYLRAARGWVAYPTSRVEDPLSRPLLALDTAAEVPSWTRVEDGHYRGSAGGNAVDLWVDGRDRPVRVETVRAESGATRRIRLELSEYGAAASIVGPASARRVADAGAAFEAVQE